MHDSDNALRDAMQEALEALALHLGGTSDTGGPVEHATQIKGRDELGVLLTDRDNRVLGRVWLEFGGDAKSPDPAHVTTQPGQIGLHASLRSETVTPPAALEDWLKGH
jgi:hypothetical protein